MYEILVVFLEPDVLVELRESERKPEGVPDSIDFLVLPIGSAQEVVPELLHRQQTLQTAVHITEIGVVLEAHYSI